MAGELLSPTFEITIDAHASDIAARFKDALAAADGDLDIRWARGERHALLTVARHRRRWWSPWLHVDVSPADTGGASILGRFTPNPGLWTAYMLSLIALLAVALFGVALGLAQMTLERHAWGWWLLLVSFAVAGALLAGARLAQRLASDQMHELRALVEHASAA